MSRGLAVLVVCLLPAAPAVGQLYFSQDVAGSVAAARASERPLMVYLRDRTRGCCYRSERAFYETLRDPRVVAATAGFVCVEVSPAEQAATLEGWGISVRTSRLIVFASPDGTKLGTASAASDAVGMVKAAGEARAKYAEHLWQTRYKPVLTDDAAPPLEQRAALLGIQQHRLRIADAWVVSYLKQSTLPRDLRFQAYRTLAALSTETAVEALMQYARDDKRAAEAVTECSTDAVRPLLKYLGAADEKQHLAAYRALMKICGIRGLKPDAFWSRPDAEAKQKEIDRVKQAALERVPAAGALAEKG